MPHSLTSFKPRSGTSGVRLNLRRSGGWPKKKNNRSYKNNDNLHFTFISRITVFTQTDIQATNFTNILQ